MAGRLPGVSFCAVAAKQEGERRCASFVAVGRGGGVHPMMLKKRVLPDGIFRVTEDRAFAAFPPISLRRSDGRACRLCNCRRGGGSCACLV